MTCDLCRREQELVRCGAAGVGSGGPCMPGVDGCRLGWMQLELRVKGGDGWLAGLSTHQEEEAASIKQQAASRTRMRMMDDEKWRWRDGEDRARRDFARVYHNSVMVLLVLCRPRFGCVRPGQARSDQGWAGSRHRGLSRASFFVPVVSAGFFLSARWSGRVVLVAGRASA